MATKSHSNQARQGQYGWLEFGHSTNACLESEPQGQASSDARANVEQSLQNADKSGHAQETR
jgi:hypothetical protein